MTPPNELEQLAQFQDAIQSDEGLERLRAMQYLQQMNNQGIMGLPQVTQQPVIQRGNSGRITFKNLAEVDAAKDAGQLNVGDTFLVENMPGEFTIDSDGSIGLLELDAGTKAMMREGTMQDFDIISDQYDSEGNLKSDSFLRRNQDDGPVIERFNGGLTNLRGAEGLKETVNYMEEGTIQEANAKAMAENQPSFMFQNQLYETGTMTPIRENTEKGIRERATLGGIVEKPSMIKTIFSPYKAGPGSKITFNEPPQPVNLPIQSQDVTNTFMPTNMVEYTPPFYGGMAIPPGGNQPKMVPADAQGNPIMPFSKQAMSGLAVMRKNPETGNFESSPNNAGLMAAQGGYVQNLAGGGIIQGRELQQLQEGGLVNLPVVNMGLGGFIRNVFRAPARIVKGIAKGAKKIVKSKAFKALAPLVLAVAAPYALGALAPSVFGAGATALGGALSTSGALGYGIATGLGSMAGNLLGGARFGDAARQGLMSGATGGLFKGLGSGNWMGTGNPAAVANAGKLTQVGRGAENIQAGTQVAKAPVTGGNPFAAAQQSQQAAQQAAQASKIGSNILTTPGGIEAYTGTGLQPTITAEGVPTNIAQNLSTPEFSNIQFTTEGVPSAPEATRTGFFGKGPLSNTGGTLGGEGYTGSTFDKIKQVGKNIYADYANPRGVAKLVGMDLMQPNWDEVYASEEAMEQQLQDMGYTIDTGFGGTKVYRDAAGKTLPSNLTAEQALNIALGRTPRTRLYDRIGFEPNASEFVDKAQGGLVSLAHGGEFSGKVEGDGHGMEDNVYMPIVEKGQGQQIGTLAVSPSEYVVDAHTMSALGNGNADEGAKVMDSVIAGVRKKAFGTTQQPKEIDGLNALMPMMERA